jgi:hypothetical protein
VNSETIITFVIFSLAAISYIVGFVEIAQKKYKPSLFTRTVLLLLAINGFAALQVGGAAQSALALGWAYLIGNIIIWSGSVWRGDYSYSKIEIFSTILLIVSGLLWIIVDAPLINLIISIVANSAGLLPTYRRVLADPKSESSNFWLLFFFASLLSLLTIHDGRLISLLLPIYFCFTDGSLFLLSKRKIVDS